MINSKNITRNHFNHVFIIMICYMFSVFTNKTYTNGLINFTFCRYYCTFRTEIFNQIILRCDYYFSGAVNKSPIIFITDGCSTIREIANFLVFIFKHLFIVEFKTVECVSFFSFLGDFCSLSKRKCRQQKNDHLHERENDK